MVTAEVLTCQSFLGHQLSNYGISGMSAVLVDCKVTFEKAKYNVEEDVKLWVYIRCKSQFALRFSKLSVNFNDEVSPPPQLYTRGLCCGTEIQKDQSCTASKGHIINPGITIHFRIVI